MLAEAGIVTICVFRSTPQSIQKYASSSLNDQSLALSDKTGFVYKTFQLKRKSVGGGFVGLSWEIGKGIRRYNRYINLVGAAKDVVGSDIGKVGQMPADFMIDENGVIVDLFRAASMSDHMTFDRVEDFIPEEKRCKCHRENCISPRCRNEHAEIKKQAEAMLFVG